MLFPALDPSVLGKAQRLTEVELGQAGRSLESAEPNLAQVLSLGSCEAGHHLVVVARELCDRVRDDLRGAWSKADRPVAGAELGPAGWSFASARLGSSKTRWSSLWSRRGSTRAACWTSRASCGGGHLRCSRPLEESEVADAAVRPLPQDCGLEDRSLALRRCPVKEPAEVRVHADDKPPRAVELDLLEAVQPSVATCEVRTQPRAAGSPSPFRRVRVPASALAVLPWSSEDAPHEVVSVQVR